MPKDFHQNVALLFQIGALAGLAAGILMPYHTVFCFLMLLVCLLWLVGCFLSISLRAEFAAARKYLILAILLIGLYTFLPSGPLRILLLFAVCMLLYFSVALQCGGIAALAEQCEPNDRVHTLPGVVNRFEYAMIASVAAQMISASISTFAFICDLVGMAAYVVGFFTLWKYFNGKEDVK